MFLHLQEQPERLLYSDKLNVVMNNARKTAFPVMEVIRIRSMA
jgi:hypothetical protein